MSQPPSRVQLCLVSAWAEPRRYAQADTTSQWMMFNVDIAPELRNSSLG